MSGKGKIPSVPQRKAIAMGDNFGTISKQGVAAFKEGGQCGFTPSRETQFRQAGNGRNGFKKGARSGGY